MHDEPINIPDAQQARITAERLDGWQVVGWVKDKGWEAVINRCGEWGRVLPDGTMKINGAMVQDKTLALTEEYSGMYGMGYQIEAPQTIAFSSRKTKAKTKYLNKFR